MEMESCVPPGFRFHPTEEELVDYYLKRKINDLKIDLDVIIEIDLYKIEPWDIQERCKLGYDEQNEWYFFSHKDKKYPTGTRTNRATGAGFWKATGRDKAVVSKNRIIGMRKTLVFYKGRAPNGRKTDWIMHEYRLQTTHHAPPQEEGWVVCRAFRKPVPSQSHQIRPNFEPWNDNNNNNYNNNHIYSNNNNHAFYATENAYNNYSRPPNFQANFGVDHKNNNTMVQNNSSSHNCFVSAQEMVLYNQRFPDNNNNNHEVLPQLDSPSSVSASFAASESFQNTNGIINGGGDFDQGEIRSGQFVDDDWKNLDSLLMASHLADNGNNNNNSNNLLSPSTMPQSSDYDHQQHYFHGCFHDDL